MSIKVKFTYEFEFDNSGLSEEFVNVQGLAKDCAFAELKSQINDDSITPEDFEIEEEF